MTVRHINGRVVIERGLQTELVLSAEEARELERKLREIHLLQQIERNELVCQEEEE